MRTRKWLLLAVVLAVAGTGLFLLVQRYWPEPGISPYNYRQIRLGMSAQDVEQVIGLPPGIHRTRQPIGGITSAGNWGHTVAEEGVPKSELPDGMQGEARAGRRVEVRQWWGTYHAIRIAGNEDGKVVGKYLIQIPWD
jgi:hypothetical protein